MQLSLAFTFAVFLTSGATSFAEPADQLVTVNLQESLVKDPCYKTIVLAVKSIQASSMQPLKLKNVDLLSETNERIYLIRFEGLLGAYKLILDNDRNSRCFMIQQFYEFN